MIKQCFRIIYVVISSLTFVAVLADPIHEAAMDGDVDKVKLLLAEGVDVNAPDPDGTPLLWALFSNQSAMARLLLERGADPNVSGWSGTPMQMAVGNGDNELVKLLLDHGGDPNLGDRTMPLYVAAQKGNLEVVTLLLDKGADPTFTTDEGTTALHEAARIGNLEITRRLVDSGAHVNALTSAGKPPLHFAAAGRHTEVLEYLRGQGAVPGEIAPITDLLASADPARGEIEAEKACSGCHSLEKGINANGPSLWNVLGSTRGGVSDYPYSPVFSELSGTWTFETLNEFLARPFETVPGTKMELRPIADPQERADIIAYIRTLSDNPIPLP